MAPGDSIELDAVVHTLETPEASGFMVSYTIFPFVPKKDNAGNEIVPRKYVPGEARNVVISDEDGSSDSHSVRLAPVVATPEASEWLSCAPDLAFTDYLGCKLVRGVSTAAFGLWQIGVLGWQANVAIFQGKVWAVRTAFRFLIEDDEARQTIIDEITAELIEMQRLGHEFLQNISVSALGAMVGEAMDRGIRRIVDVLETGDLKLIAGEMAEIAGENIDMVIEAIVAARVLVKATVALGGRTGLLRTAIGNGIEQQSRDTIDAALRVIREQGERALPGSRVMRAGVDVTDVPAIAKAYGVSPDDLETMFRIAEDQGVTLVFRSRSPKSIELIDSGVALPKPQGVKTKGVNDLDMDYFGYPSQYDSRVVVVEPPVQSVDEIQGFLDNHPKLNELQGAARGTWRRPSPNVSRHGSRSGTSSKRIVHSGPERSISASTGCPVVSRSTSIPSSTTSAGG